MNVSPYASDTVLIAAVEKLLPNGHTKQIIIANSPVTQKVMNSVESQNLPPGIQSQIDAAQLGVSPRRELELGIKYSERQLSLALNSLSRFFQHDTLTVNRIDSLIQILQGQEGLNRELQLAEAYIQAERLTEADLQLDTLDIIGGLDNFSQLQRLVIDIIQNSASFDTLRTDTALKLIVEGFANDTLRQGYLQARAMLCLVFGGRFQERIEELPQEIQAKTSNEASQGEEATNVASPANIPVAAQWVKFYPNPASESVTIDFLLLDVSTNAEIEVYNIFGTKVYQLPITQQSGLIQHDISNLPQGIYLYAITTDQGVISQEKITVSR